MICLDMAMNVIFFVDNSMHKVYINYGKYNFIQQLPQIVYSAIISEILDVFLSYLCLTDTLLYKIKKYKNENNHKFIIKKELEFSRMKLIGFLLFIFVFMIFFWYLISSFCAVYKNTQIILLKDSFSSFLTSLIHPFIIYLFPTIFRIIALKYTKNNLKLLFQLSDLIPIF